MRVPARLVTHRVDSISSHSIPTDTLNLVLVSLADPVVPLFTVEVEQMPLGHQPPLCRNIIDSAPAHPFELGLHIAALFAVLILSAFGMPA